jgi:hypothetical protein
MTIQQWQHEAALKAADYAASSQAVNQLGCMIMLWAVILICGFSILRGFEQQRIKHTRRGNRRRRQG